MNTKQDLSSINLMIIVQENIIKHLNHCINRGESIKDFLYQQELILKSLKSIKNKNA